MNRSIIDVAEHYVGLRVNNVRTARCYFGAARSLAAHAAHDSIANFSVDDLLLWKRTLSDKVRPSTIASYLRHLRVLGKHAVEYEMMSENVFMKLKPPPFKGLPKLIKEDTYERAVQLLQSDELEPGWFWFILLEVVRATAIRNRQVTEMRWEDVNFEKRTLSLTWIGSKTGHEMDLPLTDDVEMLLMELKKRTTAIRAVRPSDQVFNVTLFNPHYAGNRMSTEQLSGFYKRLSEKINSGRVTGHRLRHTRATELGSMSNVNVFALQDLLGHTDIRMTRAYVSPSTGAIRELLENAQKLRKKKSSG